MVYELIVWELFGEIELVYVFVFYYFVFVIIVSFWNGEVVWCNVVFMLFEIVIIGFMDDYDYRV